MRRLLLALALVLVIALVAALASALPLASSSNIVVYPVSPPAWYNASLPPAGLVHVWDYPATVTATFGRTSESFSDGTAGAMTLVVGSIVSGGYDSGYCFQRAVSAAAHSENLLRFTVTAPATVSFWAYCTLACTVTVAGSSTSLSANTWTKITRSLSSAGEYTVSWSFSTSAITTVTIRLDAFAVSSGYFSFKRTASASSATRNETHVTAVYVFPNVYASDVLLSYPPNGRVTYTWTGANTVQAIVARNTLQLSQSPLTLTLTNYTLMLALARAPAGFVFHSANASDYHYDAAIVTSGRALSYTLMPRRWNARWTLPAVRIAFLDASLNAFASLTLSPGEYNITLAQAPAFAKLNSTLHYTAACGNSTSFAFPANAQQVAFKVDDFGQGFEALKAYTLDGRLVHAVRLDALRQAVLNLTLYAPFSLSLWKPGEERAFGIVTVSQLNYHIHVVPAAVELKEAGWARAYYNRSANAFVVEADCVAPPCAVKLYKIAGSLQNRTLLAAWTCSARYCRYTLLAADPLVQAEVSDSEGRVAVGFAGLSLPFNPWLAPIATWFAERAFGLQHLFGSASAAARFIVFLVALAVFWSMSTVGQWEVGLLAACAVLLVSQLWTGFDFLSSAVGLATFIAAFSLVIKKVREV